jgi:hypothetical protein
VGASTTTLNRQQSRTHPTNRSLSLVDMVWMVVGLCAPTRSALPVELSAGRPEAVSWGMGSLLGCSAISPRAASFSCSELLPLLTEPSVCPNSHSAQRKYTDQPDQKQHG